MAKKEIEQTEIEAPYELPEGWKWCRLGEVADWGSGGTPSRKNPKYYQGSIPWIKTGELNETYIFDSEEKVSEDAIKHSSAKIFPKETVVMAMYGATIGKTAIFGIDASTNQACACAICHKELDNHFLFNFLKSKKDYFLYNAKGGAQPNISQEIIKNTLIPLPPTLAEQQRIVNRIESMFAKLDEAKEKAQNVVDGFETRKAAILHKAFTGELTAKWRKENGVSLNISESTFKGICHKITDGFHNSPKPVSEGYPYIMAGDIKENGIDFNNGLFMDKKNHDELYNKAHPEKGDILVVNIGAGTGKSAIIDVDFEFSFKNCAILKLNKDIVNPMYVYLFFYLKKDYILKEITRGGAQPFLSLKMINELTISYPSLPEQVEIVRILDIIIEKENKAKQAAEAVLEQIDLLKKSILARAFRGEL